MSSTNQQLQQAYDLIKAGKKAQAVKILASIVTIDEDNPNAWWLMANASELPEDIREALEHVLRLKPNDIKAQNMLSRLNERYPVKAKNDEFSFDDDPFSDDPFADVDDYQPTTYRSSVGKPQNVTVTKSSSGTNPIMIVLAFLGIITLVGCLICVGTGAIGGLAIFQGVQEVVNDPDFLTAVSDPTMQAFMANPAQALEQITSDPTLQAALNDPTLQAALNDPTVQAAMREFGLLNMPQSLPNDLNRRGSIQLGTTQEGRVDTFVPDSWTFEGESGSSITIETAGVGDLDTQLGIYNADGQLLAQNDDMNSSTVNSRIEFTLPYNGRYTIVVKAFSSGGNYELTVR